MAKKPKTVLIEETTLINVEKEAKKQKRTVHYILVETIENKYGK